MAPAASTTADSKSSVHLTLFLVPTGGAAAPGGGRDPPRGLPGQGGDHAGGRRGLLSAQISCQRTAAASDQDASGNHQPGVVPSGSLFRDHHQDEGRVHQADLVYDCITGGWKGTGLMSEMKNFFSHWALYCSDQFIFDFVSINVFMF